jgi:hypothetical protein
MNEQQNLGLGELGQRMQAMSDPVADSRLRPYHGGQPENGHSGPQIESYDDVRNSPAPYSGNPQSPNPYGHQPYPGNTPASGSGREAPSSWETASPRPYSNAPSSGTDHPQAYRPASLPPPPPAPEPPKSGLHRALDAIRSTLPLVQKLLPLIDSNFATAVGALVAPHVHPPPPLPPPVVHIDMEPLERGLAEVRSGHRELRSQVLEQVTTLKRVEDHLERVREATDRNTLEQQELVEDLRSVGSRLNIFAIIGLILLAGSLALNILLIFQLQHILR